jgi:hypothetical protein
MASEQKSVLTQLVSARDVTKLTGTVDELQSHNLQMWGRIAFSPAKFGLNWSGADRVVEYDVVPGPPEPPERTAEELLAYLNAIDTSVKDLLGPEWLLLILEGGKVVFTGERKDIVRPDPEDADKLLKQGFKPQGEATQVPARGEMETDVRRDKN